jgi:taurine transport system permease protein
MSDEAFVIEHGLPDRVPEAPPRRPLGLPQPWVFLVGSALFWLAVWGVLAALQVVPPLFLPPPSAVLARFIGVTANGYADATLVQHAGASLFRVLSALVAAWIVAVPVGIGMGLSPVVRGIFDPVIEAYRPVPPLAYLPLVVIWFGIGEEAKILLIFLAIVPAIALSTSAGVRSVPSERINAARTLGATRWQVLAHVIFCRTRFPKSLSARGSALPSDGPRWLPPSW